MLVLMEQQMTQLTNLHAENAQLRNNAAAIPPQQQQQHQPRPKTKSPDRPVINTDTDEQEWELFKDSWNRYKTMTAVTDVNMLRLELRAACSQDVNRLLFEYVGAEALNTANEEELLNFIKGVAVKGTHKEVHRMKFFKLYQMDGETITQFVARLRSHAILCKFKIDCENHEEPNPISFADEMIAHQLLFGLRNKQHQLKILSETAALPTLRDKIERLHCLEETENSTNIMRANPPTNSSANAAAESTNAAARSTYRRDQFKRQPQQPQQQDSRNNRPCRGCGRTSHDGKTMARKDCPAFNKNCGNCGIKGHFRAVCMKGAASRSQSNAIEETFRPQQQEESQPEDAPSFAFATPDEDFRLAPFSNNRP